MRSMEDRILKKIVVATEAERPSAAKARVAGAGPRDD